MKYTVSIAFSPLDQLIEIAKAAEELGFDNIALPDSISMSTVLSIWVFHFSARRPTVCFDSAVSPRFHPVRSGSPPHVNHSRDPPVCAFTAHETLAKHKTTIRHVARIIFMSSSRKGERRE